MQNIVPTLDTVLTIIGVFYFLFAIFRRLRQDYPENEVVKMSFLTIIFSSGLLYLFSVLNLKLTFLAGLLSLIFAVLIFSQQSNWRFWAVMENLTLPGLITWFLVSFGNWFQLGIVGLILLSNLYWGNYRRFSWYASGKIGFVFLADLVQFSLFQVGLDFWRNRLLELSSWIILFWLGVAGIIFRGGQKIEN